MPASWKRLPYGAALTALAVGLGLLASAVKLRALASWQYSSDLFTFDQAMAETLRGHFMLEFTDGRELGEHAHLIFLALLPLKLLLGGQFPRFLVAVSPLAFAVCGLVLYRTARAEAPAWRAFLAAALLLLNSDILYGTLEPFFGFHPDLAAAFFGVCFVALLARERSRPSRRPWALLACFSLFVLAKEEFAACALAGLAWLCWRAPGRWTRPLAAAAAAVLVFDLLLIRSQRTPFNVFTHAGLLRSWVERPAWPSPSAEFWTPLLLLGAGLAALAGFDDGLDPHAEALALMTLVRLPGSLLLGDYAGRSWHTMAHKILLAGAVSVQLARRTTSRRALALAAAVAAVLAGDLLLRHGPALVVGLPRLRRLAPSERERADLAELIARVEPRAVASVPPMTAVEWARAGRRFAYFPGGVTSTPRGIARYAVLPRSAASLAAGLPACYRPAHQNATFALYERGGSCGAELDAERERFRALFGPGSLEAAEDSEFRR
jgi:hypothetical protein